MHQTFRAALLFSLLALSSAATAQDAPAKAGPTTPDQPTILVTSVVPGVKSPGGNYSGAVVQFDLVNADLQKSLSGQSTRLVIDIDCAGEKIRARNMIVYKEPKQGGAAAEVRIKDDWESYQGGAYLADVARSICRQDGKAGLDVASAATARPPLVAHSPMPSAAQSPATATATRKGSRAWVQFVSSSSRSEVEGDIAKVREHLGAQIGQTPLSIQTAVIKGTSHYRGRAGPFSEQADVDTFCKSVVEMKFQCLIMQGVK